MAGDVKILIPLDGSKLAEHSLAYVAGLRPLGLSQVEIVSVAEPDAVALRRGQEDEAREVNLLGSYHREVTEDLRIHTSLEVETKVLSGPPAAAIIEEIEAFQPDYLIVSTHGASGVSRWRFGSVADKLIRGAGCATLVVGPKAAEREQWLTARLMPVFRSILVPLDGSELSEQALPEAQRFAEAFGAQIHLVSVVAVGSIGLDAAWAGVSPKLTEDLTQQATDYLDGVRGKTPGLANSYIAAPIGSPAQALSDYIADNAIDLVIMTSHGRGGLLRTALGSTTDRLLGGAAPILIVRARD